MAEDPRLADNAGRVRHEAAIDAAISAWTSTMEAPAVLDKLAAAGVPAGPIYSVADMMQDAHFQARGLFQDVNVDGKPLKIPAMVPHLSATPGSTDWPGPTVGAHNREVYGELLGYTDAELASLRQEGVI
jgi:crotonobetainyl-CoA:carnitine CoA-transferase CaiB-like acyl-CoA transferase